MAQGQEIISTATAAAAAFANPPPATVQAMNVRADKREHSGDEDRADPIRKLFHGRTRTVRLAHQLDDARQHARFTQRRRAIAEAAGGVDGAADHLRTHAFFDWHRLTRQHRLINVRRSGHDLAVDRNLFARPHHDEIGAVNLGDRGFDFDSVADDVRRRGLQRDQFSQCARGLPARASFQRPPTDDERQNEDRRFVVDIGRDPACGEEIRRECYGGGIDHGRSGADRYQRVHIRGAMDPGFPCARENPAPGPRHDKQGDCKECELRHAIVHGAH